MTIDAPALKDQPVIVGGGVAGLATALFLAPQPVVLLAKAPLGSEASSPWAQGGMAASVGDDDDPALHLADTLAAGDGLGDAAVARRIVDGAPGAVAALARLGVRFDRDGQGGFALGLEAAHRRRRIVHAHGDGTGRELVRALGEAVRRTPSITLIEHVDVRRVLTDERGVAGILAVGPQGVLVLSTACVVLATGGVGGLYDDTTNPVGSFGHGLALAARAGAALADLEFVQFHPTALASGSRPLPLVSEAVRGEGALIIDATGRRIMDGVPGAELAPRDVVARAVWQELARGGSVFLDARACLGARFAARFPGIDAACRAAGFDPATMPIPIRPAAHYHMGGIAVDGEGRSTVAGLWACGEVAATGLHGANRLASNSLTEAAVCAAWVAESVAGAAPRRHAEPRPLHHVPPAPRTERVRGLVSRHLGVIRDGDGLTEATASLLPLAREGRAAADPALVGLMMAVAALRRTESRGAHLRADCPGRAPHPAHARLTLEQAVAHAEALSRPALALAKNN
ncbi:L-aspartate oxidase [Chelatococcus reniformis]|uniref:L-aspartate oxidase n=1 Tax=Chelatococcus reniformis TaxID=1494448 RepID=A0A916XR74_9HYPH|nr:L-aspartate oxidase [Chelatococcus reniformis]GGC94468.1 L-aspartate oxidase [Chelatococcus reniformis]